MRRVRQCPLCGGDPWIIQSADQGDWRLQCCGLESTPTDTRRAAEIRWNTLAAQVTGKRIAEAWK